jgi:hypothetical protein
MLPTVLARHGRIKGLILELRNKSILHSRTDADDIARIDAEISKWWNDAQELLDPLLTDESGSWDSDTQEAHAYTEENSPQGSLQRSHKLLLFVQKHELVILLNRPIITSGYGTLAHAAALEDCIGASKAIISSVYRHISRGMKAVGNKSGRIHDALVWPVFVWLVWQSGLILLYAAFEGRYSVETARRFATHMTRSPHSKWMLIVTTLGKLIVALPFCKFLHCGATSGRVPAAQLSRSCRLHCARRERAIRRISRVRLDRASYSQRITQAPRLEKS